LRSGSLGSPRLSDDGEEKPRVQPTFTSEELSAGAALFNRPWQLLKSVPQLHFLPPADRYEVAFAGRSNVGKSSLINALVGQRGLARTSNTPGRTQELNFFQTSGFPLYVVDMPGYGFAEAPKTKIEAWMKLVRDYLRGRPTLLRVLLLIDARHGTKSTDAALMTLMDDAAVSYQAVLTKTDKIKPVRLNQTLAALEAELATHPAAHARILATSARTGSGIEELRAQIAALTAAPEPASGKGSGAGTRSLATAATAVNIRRA
jgi:GTP-binding protein